MFNKSFNKKLLESLEKNIQKLKTDISKLDDIRSVKQKRLEGMILYKECLNGFRIDRNLSVKIV